MKTLRRRLEAVSAAAGRAVLCVFYLAAAPFFVPWAKAGDPLRRRATGWIPRATRDRTRDDAARQY